MDKIVEDDDSAQNEEWLARAPLSEIKSKTDAIRSENRVFTSSHANLNNQIKRMRAEMNMNIQKINLNRVLPYLVASIVEILDLPPENPEPEKKKKSSGPKEVAPVGESKRQRKNREGLIDTHKCAVIKTSHRSTVFLPEIGLEPAKELQPGDMVGVNKDTFLIIEKLPPEHDSRVKSMELDERPSEDFQQIGGLSKQIEELIEAVVLPMEHPDRFEEVGIRPPKGVLLYGAPGTGKTLLARAVAAKTKSTFLKLAGPQLVQMYVGDGAKIVRDAFALAKEKEPTIIFIDELDAIGSKRIDSDHGSDREVQRTLLELLNQLDGFTQNENIKVIAATNRVDVLDPALLRSGRIDKKIELPTPNLVARAQILKIHSRRMNVDKDVNYDELARSTDDFNGAQLKAVCVEAGMIALRRGGSVLTHEDFVSGIAEVQAKKKSSLQYFT